jgi:hypothetical protein
LKGKAGILPKSPCNQGYILKKTEPMVISLSDLLRGKLPPSGSARRRSQTASDDSYSSPEMGMYRWVLSAYNQCFKIYWFLIVTILTTRICPLEKWDYLSVSEYPNLVKYYFHERDTLREI